MALLRCNVLLAISLAFVSSGLAWAVCSPAGANSTCVATGDTSSLLQNRVDMKAHEEFSNSVAVANVGKSENANAVGTSSKMGISANQTVRRVYQAFSTSERDEMLSVTNKYRCMHGAPAAVWSNTLASEMEKYIKNMNRMVHDPTIYGTGIGRPCGENLFFASAAGMATPTAAADGWYSEVNDCQTGSPTSFTDGCLQPKPGKMTGHFTAMVWTSATEIGCAYSDSRNYIGCRYKVPGETSKSSDTTNMLPESNYAKHVNTRSKTETECGVIPLNKFVVIKSHLGNNLQDNHGLLKPSTTAWGWETWTLVPAGDGKVFVRSHLCNNMQDNHGTPHLSTTAGGWEKWTIVNSGVVGKFFIRSHLGNDLQDNHGLLTLTSAPTAGGWERWSFVENPSFGTHCGCIAAGSLGKCDKCLNDDQCGSGRYCCPFMKKCVASASEACYAPIADCSPPCFESDPTKCTQCKEDMSKWQKPTCR